MSDETPTPEAPDAGASDAAAAETAAASTDVEVMEHDAPAHAEPPSERPTFTGKFLAPLVIPVFIVAAIAFFVLNVSRIFLASEGARAVVWASIITIVILVGGSAIAASPKLRSSSLTLIIGGALFVILMGGLISIGQASPTAESGPEKCAPVKSKITIVAGANNSLRYTFPKGNAVKAGCVDIVLDIEGSHTLLFDTPPASAAFPELDNNLKTWAGTLPAGEYKFHCTIPGHAAGGMIADLSVTP